MFVNADMFVNVNADMFVNVVADTLVSAIADMLIGITKNKPLRTCFLLVTYVTSV